MCYIPDPIERLEMWEGRMAHELGNPDGSVNCAYCKQPIQPGQECELGTPPHILPACQLCFTMFKGA